VTVLAAMCAAALGLATLTLRRRTP
jgi:hypothetical protein